MEITKIDWCQVEVRDETGYRFDVFRQGDGKWRCLRCQRLRCAHAKWVAAQNPMLPDPPQLSAADIDDILTY